MFLALVTHRAGYFSHTEKSLNNLSNRPHELFLEPCTPFNFFLFFPSFLPRSFSFLVSQLFQANFDYFLAISHDHLLTNPNHLRSASRNSVHHIISADKTAPLRT